MKTLTIFSIAVLFGTQLMAQTPQVAPKSMHDESIDAFIMASRYLKSQQYAEASMFLDKAITKDPTNYVFYYERGRCYLNLKNYDKAMYCFKKVTELKNDNSDAHLMMGYIYANTGREKQAIHEYDLAFTYEESPATRLAQKLSILNIMDKHGLLKDANKHIADASDLGIDNCLLNYYNGKYKNLHHQYKEARESLLSAVAYFDTKPQAKNSVAMPVAGINETDKNIDTKDFEIIEPIEQAKYYYELYYAYYHLNQYSEAQKLANNLDFEPYKTKIKSMNTNYLYAIAYAHFMVYDLEKCKHVLDDILQKDKHNHSAHKLMVKLSELQTDKTLLIKQLENAVAHIKDPVQKDKMQHELLVLEVEKGEYDKAILIAEEIIIYNPEDHNALFLKAISLDKLGKNQEAIKILQSIIAFKDLDQKTISEYEFELGLIAEKMNNVSLATEAFKHTTYLYFRAAALEELKKVEHLKDHKSQLTKAK